MPITSAIVDLDGTMIDTLGDFVAALNLMLPELPLQNLGAWRADRALAERMVGKGSEHLIASLLAQLRANGVKPQADVSDESLFDLAFAAYQKHYDTVNGQQSMVYPGVIEGLQRWRSAGLKLACLTNKPTGFAKSLLGLKGLDGFFEVVFGGDAFERKKPDPLPLLKTCDALGSTPAQTLMIGDSSNDAQAARAAGCPVILVTYGYNHGEPVRSVDADGFVDSLQNLRWQSLG